ncbi:MAG: hypothetical protein ABW205_00360 [Burkholderiales bacterium]
MSKTAPISGVASLLAYHVALRRAMCRVGELESIHSHSAYALIENRKD